MNASREWSAADAAAVLRRPTAHDDKYSRGVVGLRTGSDAYPGAAVLGVEAAWRTGVGMVRYLGPERPRALVLHRRPETVTADGRVQAWVIGSGTDAADRTPDETAALRGVLQADVPVVVDAGALDLIGALSRVDRAADAETAAADARPPRVLTPHDREHAALRKRLGLGEQPDRVAAAAETAAATGAVVLLKGATTIVAAPDGGIRTVTTDVPWLATAGTGDVLAGILGALLAGATAAPSGSDGDGSGDGGGDGGAGATPEACAATAAWLHGRAAAAASEAHRGGPVVALEVAEAAASVVGGMLAGG
ncbi:ADP-dependent NAD(P)H-hydrate dehydratase [Microbacterium aurum]